MSDCQRTLCVFCTGPYRKGYPRGKKMAAGHPPCGWATPPTIRPYGRLGVARPQGVEGLGMAGPGETLGSPWIPLPVRAWFCAV